MKRETLKDEVIRLIEASLENDCLSDEEVAVLKKLTKADLYVILKLTTKFLRDGFNAGCAETASNQE